MRLIESTRKASLYDDGTRFIVAIGYGKRVPKSDDPLPFRRDKNGLLILKESSWRYPYGANNREEMLGWAKKLYDIHS